MYNWEFKNWPNFTYSEEGLSQLSYDFARESGLANGLVLGLDEDLRQGALLEILIAEAIKTSEIEGEFISREDVMSSIKNNLGMPTEIQVKDKKAIGIAQLITEINNSFEQTLDINKIQHWHRLLMQHDTKINSGTWRTGDQPMQVISGRYGKEEVHYEAPPSGRVAEEMDTFVRWYHKEQPLAGDKISAAIIKTAIAHIYFESIHPFEDGNGRIGRALAEFTLAQSLGSPVILSLSKTIEKNKKLYYASLKNAQSGLELSEWILYFAGVILDAQIESKELVLFTIQKARFFDKYAAEINERQLKIINRMLESGAQGFKGGMTASKYIAITKTSKATATRDLQHLLEIGAFSQNGMGRSVNYDIKMPK